MLSINVECLSCSNREASLIHCLVDVGVYCLVKQLNVPCSMHFL